MSDLGDVEVPEMTALPSTTSNMIVNIIIALVVAFAVYLIVMYQVRRNSERLIQHVTNHTSNEMIALEQRITQTIMPANVRYIQRQVPAPPLPEDIMPQDNDDGEGDETVFDRYITGTATQLAMSPAPLPTLETIEEEEQEKTETDPKHKKRRGKKSQNTATFDLE